MPEVEFDINDDEGPEPTSLADRLKRAYRMSKVELSETKLHAEKYRRYSRLFYRLLVEWLTKTPKRDQEAGLCDLLGVKSTQAYECINAAWGFEYLYPPQGECDPDAPEEDSEGFANNVPPKAVLAAIGALKVSDNAEERKTAARYKRYVEEDHEFVFPPASVIRAESTPNPNPNDINMYLSVLEDVPVVGLEALSRLIQVGAIVRISAHSEWYSTSGREALRKLAALYRSGGTARFRLPGEIELHVPRDDEKAAFLGRILGELPPVEESEPRKPWKPLPPGVPGGEIDF